MREKLEPGHRQPFDAADPDVVRGLIERVRKGGDAAVRELTARFDGVDVPDTRVPMEDCHAAFESLAAADQQALRHAAGNITCFAEAQRALVKPLRVEIAAGVILGHRVLPVRRVACYVPGGRYPLPSTALMTVIPARVAGVNEIVVFSPPGEDGRPSRWILAAASLAGAHEVHAIGGVQAIASAAYGTERVRPVDLVVGPGNIWVTEAKRQVFGDVGIDALAGPSEVVVLADRHANPARVAADMLAQAEHDEHAEAIAVTDDAAMAREIRAAIDAQLRDLPTADVAARSIRNRGAVITVADRDAMIAWANARAPEHLHLQLVEASKAADQCTAFGSLFIGEASAEVFGDYCSGVNHVLPTGGSARHTAGLSVITFLRLPTWQQLSVSGAAALAPTASKLARIEGLEAHARASDARSSGGRRDPGEATGK